MEQTRIECETFDMLKSQEKNAVPRRIAVSFLSLHIRVFAKMKIVFI